MEKITILIVDDHTLLRETWTLVLNADPRFQVVGSAGSGENAVELARILCPQVVIMDIALQGMDGIAATREIHAYAPSCRILGVSLHTQPAYARKMLQMGAMGYITKNSSSKEMIRAILEICNGTKYICDEIKNVIATQVIEDKNTTAGVECLSDREIEVMEFIRTGESSKEIAEALKVSRKTVEVHRYNIMKKLSLRNVAELVNFAHTYQLELSERRK
jgi:DNA-binding NarL/FixJ family response regulator